MGAKILVGNNVCEVIADIFLGKQYLGKILRQFPVLPINNLA